MPFPPLFLQRMAAWLGPEFPAFLEALESPPAIGLRVNSLKISPADFQARSPFPLQPVPGCPEGFTIPETTARPGAHPYHEAGLYYLQDPAAMLAAPLLAPQPGEWVLDLCAAPGGKTTHLAARMQNQGVLIANEIHPRRVRVLAENLDRCGVTNAAVLNETPERLAARWEGLFDRVLVDAPCSGEGMFGKEEAAARDWSEEAIRGCARRQSAILEGASRLVRPGGYLLYATCTFAPEENEGVIGHFLRAHRDFEIVDVSETAPASLVTIQPSSPHPQQLRRYPLPSPDLRSGEGREGRRRWRGRGEDEQLPRPIGDSGHPEWVGETDIRLRRAVRLWPHRGPGRGHFYALLRRAGEEHPHRPRPRTRLPGRTRALYDEFIRQTLRASLPEEGLMVLGNHLYRAVLPPEMWEGLRVFRPGWLLGQMEGTAFVPSRALAMGIRPEAAQEVCQLELNDPALAAFLRGEAITSPSVSGWVLVTVEEFPLGWARATRRGLRSSPHPRRLRRYPLP